MAFICQNWKMLCGYAASIAVIIARLGRPYIRLLERWLADQGLQCVLFMKASMQNIENSQCGTPHNFLSDDMP